MAENKPSPYFIRRNVPFLEDEPIVLEDSFELGDEETPLFWEYWRVIKKRLWLIGACVLAGILGTGLYIFTATPLYTASSTIMIERKPSSVVRMQDAFEPEGVNQAADYQETQHEILKKPAFAARAIRQAGLEHDPLFTAEEKLSGTGFVGGLVADIQGWLRESFQSNEWFGRSVAPISEHPREDIHLNRQQLGMDPRLVRRYLFMLEVEPVRRTSLVDISFTAGDAVMAARLANAHAEAYVSYGFDLRSQANQEAIVFLQDKLLELKERVETSEAALNSYRRKKGIITLDEKGNLVVDRLVDLNQRLTAAEAERIALESEVRVIRRGNYSDLPRVRQSTLISSLKGTLGQLEGEYADMAGEFKPGYPPLDNLKLRLDQVRRRLQKEIQSEVNTIRSAYEAARANEDQLRSKMEQQKKAALNLKDAAVQYAILAREVDTNRQLYDSVLERLKEMSVAAQVREANATVVQGALVPHTPSHPSKWLTLLAGLFLGLSGGVGLAFFLAHIDTTLKTPDEAERYLKLSSLGVVPDFLKLKHKTNGYLPQGAGADDRSIAQSRTGLNDAARDLVLFHNPRSVVSESYRTLRTAILLSRAGAPPRTILFTSATRGEGKTATAINTSVIFAQMGYRVIVIDADLRRPRGHKVLGMSNKTGLSELLTGQRQQGDVSVCTSEDNLYFIGSGAEPPNPSELLGSRKMKQLLTELQEEFDCVIIDSPPIMPVSDPVLISTMVDGVVIVVDSQHTPKQLVRDARARLKKANAKILGVVLNRVDLRNSDYSGYYKHYYSYYHET